MSGIRLRSVRRFSARTIAFVFSAAASVSPAIAADGDSAIPDLSGQWGRDMLFFEPPPSGPGPIVNSVLSPYVRVGSRRRGRRRVRPLSPSLLRRWGEGRGE